MEREARTLERMSGSKLRVGDIEVFHRWDGISDGPTVMMAHAMGTSHRLWDWQVPALEDRYRILRYDWRGHGDTTAPSGAYTLDQFVGDALGLMDALRLDKVHWVGISTGGMIGQGLGIEHPDRIASLSLCNTTPQANQAYKDFVAERQRVVQAGGMVPIWEMTDRRWFTDAFAEEANADYQAVREVFIRTTAQGYIGATSATAQLDYKNRLHLITAPTLVLGAGDDPATPPEHSLQIHDRIAGSKLVMLPGQRHFSNVEVPDQFNPPLRAFLDSVT